MEPQGHQEDSEPSNQRFNCICKRYGFGQAHIVSKTTFFRHLQEAESEEERERIQAAKYNNIPLGPGSSSRRPRGMLARRRNNILLTQKRSRKPSEDSEDSDSRPETSKRGRTTSPVDIGSDLDIPPPSHSPGPGASQSRSGSPPGGPPFAPPRGHSPSPPHQPSPSRSRSPSPPREPNPAPHRPADRRTIVYQRRRQPQVDITELLGLARFKPMSDTMAFVAALANASISDPIASLSDGALERLRNPPGIPLDISSPGIRHSISTYLALEHASQDSYDRVVRSLKTNYKHIPGVVEDIQSHRNVERLIAIHTGVEAIQHDMCPNSCHAFSGPFSHLEDCYICQTSRWDPQHLQSGSRIPAQQFTTIPLGPQIQARFRSESSARSMQYLWTRVQEILEHLRQPGADPDGAIPLLDDIAAGWDILTAVLDGDIKEHDVVLMVSLDGAQLYDSKESDCWIYVWIIVNLSPDIRYRKLNVLPGGFIPGPHKPKNVDSFLFPGFHHLAAIQREGLAIWDALTDTRYISHLYLLFTTADGPGLVYWDGMVGHSGKNGCRLYCGILGRRKGTHYYPALLCPRDRPQGPNDHQDIDVLDLPTPGSSDYAIHLKQIVAVPNQSQWDKAKTETGLTKPPLILGLQSSRSLGVPLCMTTDIMHLAGNLSDLFVSLWRGSIDVGLGDDKSTWDWAVLRDQATWTEHGELVANAGQFLPGSFDRKPCNIAEKINTQYKTWEFHLYLFGYAPFLLHSLLPANYWSNFCKLVRGFQIMSQYRITAQQLQDAHALLCSWEYEFEVIYYQLKQARIHFVRPAVHQTVHLVSEAIQKGPPICYAQWTMERTIGNLGQELRQPSRPYANIAREGVRRCQVNALLSIMPELDEPPKPLPKSSMDLGDGFVLLHKRDRQLTLPEPNYLPAIQEFLPPNHPVPRIVKWARLRLPNGQIARSLWRESLKSPNQLRVSRNIKLRFEGRFRIAEVQFFTQLPETSADGAGIRFQAVALIKLFSEPDAELLKTSFQVVAASTLLNLVVVVKVKSICSVVAMIPHKFRMPSGLEKELFCMVEKPGLDVSDLGIPYSLHADDVHDDNEPEED